MAKWGEKRINDLGKVSRGRSRHRPRDDKSLYDGIYPFVQTGDVKSAEFYLTKYSQTYNEKGLSQSKLWDKGTLCITIAANIAETAILKINACFPDSIVGFIPYEGVSDVRFIKYSFDILKKEMQAASLGATQDNFSVEKMMKFKFITPDLPTQERIADILSAYDDLIENNNRRIELLEKAAQDLYKEWFVRFRFPGHETAKFENGLPVGWEVKRLVNVASIKAGGDKPICLSEFKNNICCVPIYSNGITNEGLYGYTDKAIIFEESVTVSARGTIGFVSLRTEPYVPIVRLLSIIPIIEFMNVKYLYFYLKNSFIEGNGTSQQQLTIPDFKKRKILVPDMNTIGEFSEIVSPNFEEVVLLKRKNQNLKKQRDLLLPRLMSGKLEV